MLGRLASGKSGQLLAALALGLALVAGALALDRGLATRVAPVPPARGHDRRLGPAGAPVRVVVWSDFQCPYCGRLARDLLPRLEREYVASGRLAVEFRHFPILGPESLSAAWAAECAREQAAFWPYHDLLFREQRGENAGTYRRELFLALAGELGLDRRRFEGCLADPAALERIEADRRSGLALGLRGTPSLLVGETLLAGLPRWEALQAIVELELARSR